MAIYVWMDAILPSWATRMSEATDLGCFPQEIR